METLTAPPFPLETKVIFFRQNIMIRCGAPVLLILNRNECKYEMEKQRNPPNHKRQNNEEIDDENDGENDISHFLLRRRRRQRRT